MTIAEHHARWRCPQCGRRAERYEGEEEHRAVCWSCEQGSAPRLSVDEARALTDEVKAGAAALWSKLLTLYERGAHAALGYSSWADYCRDEFDMGKSHAYRLLDSARVVAALPASPPMGERVARELSPVLREDPEQVAEAWAEAVDRYGDRPTAEQTRQVVGEHRPDRPEGFCHRKPRDGEACGKPVIDGRNVCKGHALHDELSKDKGRCGRFVEGRRGTLQALIDLGWSRQYALEKMRENYADARDGNGAA